MTDTPQPFQGRTEETTAERLRTEVATMRATYSESGAALLNLPQLCADIDVLLKERDTLTTQLREMRSAARRVVEACNAWADSKAWGGEVMENMTEAIGELEQALKEEHMNARTSEGPGA